MSIQVEGQVRSRPQRSLDFVVLALGGLVLLPAAVAMLESPWAHGFASWTLPATLASGFLLGTLLVILPLHRRWWLVVLGTVIFLGVAGAAGAELALRSGVDAQHAFGTGLLGAYAALLGAGTPWLVLRARQPWLAVVAVWITVAGAWGTKISTQQVWWLVVLLAASVVLVGMAHLAEEKAIWDAGNLQRLGPVLWPAARTIAAVTVLVALVGLLPLGISQIQALSALWNQTPAGHTGPLTYRSPNGTPVAVLGAPLSLTSPDVSNDHIILAYNVLEGPIVTPPLLGATFDTFDGTQWTQAPVAGTAPTAGPLPAPQGAQMLKVQVTVYALPASDSGSYLLGFDQPLSFSVPTRVRLLESGAPSAVTIASWESAQPLSQGATYTTSSAILPDTVVASGTLPADVQQRMTQLPQPLDPTSLALAKKWVAGATTPTAQAQALLDGLVKLVAYDANASPPAGAEPVAWTLANKRANALTLTTTYILLGRALGLPLRMAEGYLPGTYDPATKQTEVRASDATVWAQLAVAGIGWYDLYPAANDITISVPGKIVYKGIPTPTPTHPAKQPTANPSRLSTGSRTTTPGDNPPPGSSSWLMVGVVALAVLLLIATALMFVRWKWAQVGAHLAPLGQFFARVALLARLGGVKLRPSDTAMQATGKVAAVVPSQREALVTLNGAYERTRYGPPGDRGILINVREYWERLRGALWRLVLTRPWRRTGTGRGAD